MAPVEAHPGTTPTVTARVRDADVAKQRAKESYLNSYERAVVTAEWEVQAAEARLASAAADLQLARANAERWYGP